MQKPCRIMIRFSMFGYNGFSCIISIFAIVWHLYWDHKWILGFFFNILMSILAFFNSTLGFYDENKVFLMRRMKWGYLRIIILVMMTQYCPVCSHEINSWYCSLTFFYNLLHTIFWIIFPICVSERLFLNDHFIVIFWIEYHCYCNDLLWH